MDVPQHWRLRHERLSLTGRVCSECGEKLFPARDVCPNCARPESGEDAPLRQRFFVMTNLVKFKKAR